MTPNNDGRLLFSKYSALFSLRFRIGGGQWPDVNDRRVVNCRMNCLI